MKDLNLFYNECLSILETLNIPYVLPLSISYNGRLQTKWGYCKRKNDEFEISIASVLGKDDVPDKALKSVILHELLHTCPNCFNHKKQWKAYTKQIKKAYGIKIYKTSDAEDMDVPQHYYIKCRRCEIKIPYAMKPRNVERRCIVCGSKKLSCFYKNNRTKELIWKR